MNSANLDRYFVDFLIRNSTSPNNKINDDHIDKELRDIIIRLCQVTRSQHSCLDLSTLDLPSGLETFVTKLEKLPFVGKVDSNQPILLTSNKLFLHRHYHDERQVAMLIIERNERLPDQDTERLQERLDEQFPGTDLDYQRVAALQVLTRKLTIVTGGPGTGKTSVVSRLLAILLQLEPDIRISMAAPTGKAAMRLAESIRAGNTKAGTITAPTNEVVTLHRLLGMRRDGRSWRHGPDNPIATDLLIVDEASMIDLRLMHRMLHALPAHARLMLIGDPHQLPSVATGNVLADLCHEHPGYSAAYAKFARPYVGDLPVATTATALTDAVCHLEKSYRFSSDTAVGRFSTSIKSGKAQFESSDDGTVTVRNINTELAEDGCGAQLIDLWPTYTDLLSAGENDPEKIQTVFGRARILCHHRDGFPGVVTINQAIERQLEKLGIKTPGEPYYSGRPVLVNKNDYNLRLFNGDVGICVYQSGQMMVAFQSGQEEPRYFLAGQLPDHETCFAMTVHKSQGSEFDHVTLLLSELLPDQSAQEAARETDGLLTRELVYTAVTRTRSSITIYGSADLWHQALQRAGGRVSGMADFL